jgi:hypothetical protein
MNEVKLWTCQNYLCPSRVRGKPRVILAANLGVHSEVRRKCPECAITTIIVIDGEGVEHFVAMQIMAP